MTNLNNIPEPEDQIPSQNGWNNNSFGLQKRNLKEIVVKNFLKVFGYNFGWDNPNQIWRPMLTDVAGNLKTVVGGQSANAPIITGFAVDTTGITLLSNNPNRSSFAIYNSGDDAVIPVWPVVLTYPSPSSTNGVVIPAGCRYTDNSWQGPIVVYSNNVSGVQFCILFEYF